MKYWFFPLIVWLHVVQSAPQCPVDELATYTFQDSIAGEETVVDANESTVTKQSIQFKGDVTARRGEERFFAARIDYNRLTRDINASGNMVYGVPEFAIRAEKGNYSLRSETGSFYGLDYYLSRNGVNGEAAQVDIDRKANTEELTEASFTTCARHNRSWSINAKKIRLDHDKGIGKAWGTTFRIKETPIAYFPYFSFPLDDKRKTGFLSPRLNISKSRGVDLTLPYYLNLAPNHDATLYPRFMTRRGLMLGGQYRYLLDNGSGVTSATYLPNDWQADKDRWSFNTEHQYHFDNALRLSARYQRVSDKEYIDDFDNVLDLSTNHFLESHLNATYRFSPNWFFTGEIKDYQVANSQFSDADKPYTVLPRLTAKGQWSSDNGLVISSDTELTNFNKKDTVSGWRFDETLSASYNFEKTYGFFKPTAIYRFTSYHLRHQDADKDNHHIRAIPTFSIDTGLFFDRPMTWFGRSANQSIEPRLFYLRTPYQDQSRLPDFDAALIDSSYDAMFLNNRFAGKDRIGDANQLTTALRSTITDNETGQTLASVAVGQIQYFDNRRVSLLDSVKKNTRSSIVGEGQMQVTDAINIRGFAYYDTDVRVVEKSMLGITYAPDTDKSISLSHLYDEDFYRQFDVSGVWRINDQWRTFWRWNYSTQYDKTIDAFAGLEYADCCWGLRLMARQHRESLTSDKAPESAIHLEFAFKGLGNIGSDTGSILQSVIPNYQPIYYEKPL